MRFRTRTCPVRRERNRREEVHGERYAFEASKAGENVQLREDIFLDDADDGGERKGE